VTHTDSGLATAYARAYHQIAPEPRVFSDPLAVRILGISPSDLDDRDTATLTEPDDPGRQRQRRMFVVARARFAEETIDAAFSGRAGQVVLLGAGLDTFGYRNSNANLRVFEVDDPRTQAWKRTRLVDAGIDIPTSLAFVPVDFETGALAEALRDAGFVSSEAAVFVWLGVVMYLTSSAIADTLNLIAAHRAPAWLVMDYLQPASASPPVARAAFQARRERVAALGEPWLTFFTVNGIQEMLHDYGFGDIDDRSAPNLLSGYGAGQLAAASDIQAPPHVLRARSVHPTA